jgi:hypothetical protein
VDTKSVVDAPARNIPEMIAARAERGRDLFLSSRQLILRTGPETYLVPSTKRSSKESYQVRYGGEVEECTCPDAQRYPTIFCKHVCAVALLYAARRSSRPCLYYEGYHYLAQEGPEEEEIIHRVACRRCFPR